MLKIYYLSGSQNIKIDLTSWPYWMQTGDFLNYEKSYTETQYHIRDLKNVRKDRYMTITVFGENEQDYYNNLNFLHEVFEMDVANLTPGRLYFQESYQSCYVIASAKTEWEDTDCMLDNEIRIIPVNPCWIREETRHFYHTSETEVSEGTDFPFDFPFDFAVSKTGFEQWNIDHYASSHFKMTIYGPCVEPRILINGYPRQVFTSLEANEYLVFDSRNSTVIKHLANGTTVSVYNSRQFQPSIFEKIPSGLLNIDWSGAFGFDITLYIERSEPKW